MPQERRHLTRWRTTAALVLGSALILSAVVTTLQASPADAVSSSPRSGTAPTITSVDHVVFGVGEVGTFRVTATGSPAPTFFETGALPSGITFTSSGVLSGATSQWGTFHLIIDAHNGVSPDATQSFTLAVPPVACSEPNMSLQTGLQPAVGVSVTGPQPPCLAPLPIVTTSMGDANGYPPPEHLRAPIVGIAATTDGGGYWLVGQDGGVFAMGPVGFFGSAANLHLNAPIVGIAATPDFGGYYLVAADGGVFAFGDAVYQGSMGGRPLNAPMVGIATDPVNGGYRLAAADGGVFDFGAPFLGSMAGTKLLRPVVGIATDQARAGYWLAAADGGVFAFGAPFLGSWVTDPTGPIVGIASTTGEQYWVLDRSGNLADCYAGAPPRCST